MEMSNMKKVVCLITAMMLCISLASFAFAADVEFVPSISYKGAPSIVEITDDKAIPPSAPLSMLTARPAVSCRAIAC